MKVAIGSDHAGYLLKEAIITELKNYGAEIEDFGTNTPDSVDYPDFAYPASEAVAAGIADFGVLICGTGIGMSMVANKVTGIRAACCSNVEVAQLSRQHNNANVLTFGARVIDIELAKKMILEFIEGEFEGDRHMIRVEKIHSLTGW